MTPRELLRVRDVLEDKQAELEDLLRNRELIAVDSNADRLDQIQQASECATAADIFERASARLGEVRAALRRINLGTFGKCLNCEEEIPLKSLAVMPWRALCLACRETTAGIATGCQEDLAGGAGQTCNYSLLNIAPDSDKFLWQTTGSGSSESSSIDLSPLAHAGTFGAIFPRPLKGCAWRVPVHLGLAGNRNVWHGPKQDTHRVIFTDSAGARFESDNSEVGLSRCHHIMRRIDARQQVTAP